MNITWAQNSSAQKRSVVFVCSLCAIATLALLLPRSLSILPFILGLAGFISLCPWKKGSISWDKNIPLALTAFCALALLSTVWSIEPSTEDRALKILGMFAGGVFLLTAARNIEVDSSFLNKIIVFLCAAVFVHGLFFWHEYATDFQLTRQVLGLHDPKTLPKPILHGFIFNRSLVYMALLSWPLAYGLRFCTMSRRWKWIAAGMLTAGMLAALWKTQSQTAQIITGLFLVMMLIPTNRKVIRTGLVGVIIAMMFAAPWIPQPVYQYFFAQDMAQSYRAHSFLYKASVPHRLEVWQFIALEIQKQPWIGQGVEATRSLWSIEELPLMKTHDVLHPHNAVLQIWVELGLAGILLTCAFLCHLFSRLNSFPAPAQRYFTAFFISLLAMMSMGYGLWQGWQIGMIFFIASFSLIIIKTYPAACEKGSGA